MEDRKNHRKRKNERLMKDKTIRDTKTLFELEEDYYKPKRVRSFWNNNYIEYESNGDKNNSFLLDEYLYETKPYLKDIIIDLQSSDTWKIQLTITIKFISSTGSEEI